VQRDEQHRVISPEDLLRSVAVMNVVVDDRDTFAVGLHCTRGDRHVVEEAEAHRTVAERVVARWPDEREPAGARRFDRRAGREQRSLAGRLARRRVETEERRLADREHALYMFTRVTPKHFFRARRPPLAPVREGLEQFLETLG
jgi:hypothetical protein